MRNLGISLDPTQGPAFLDEKDRFRHLYCLGKTRSGKTTFLLNLISQELDSALIVLDPIGGFANSVASIAPSDRLLYVSPAHPFVINPLTKYDWAKSAKEFIEVLNACIKATTSTIETTVLMEEIILNAIRIFSEDQKNLKYLSDFLNFEQVRKTHAVDTYWKFFDEKDFKGWLINKEKVESAKRVGARLTGFHIDPSIAPFVLGKNQLNISEIVENKKIAVFNLRGFDTNAKIYLGNLVSHAVKNYYEYEATEDSKPLYFYIDEFHQFITPFFADMLSQCGKYNISVNLAHQNHEQINKLTLNTVLGNAYTKVVFQCGFTEAEKMAKDFQLKTSQIQNLGKYEAEILIGKSNYKVMTFPPLETKEFIPPGITKQTEFNFLQDGYIEF